MDPINPVLNDTPLTMRQIRLPIWPLIKQSLALLWQERKNIPHVAGLLILATFACTLLRILLHSNVLSVGFSLLGILILHPLILVRWYRFLLLGKISKNPLSEFKQRELQLIGYNLLVIILVGLTALGVFFGAVLLGVVAGVVAHSQMVLIIISLIAAIAAAGAMAYVSSVYVLVYPHVAIRDSEAPQPVMRWARKMLLPHIWSYATANGVGDMLLLLPVIIIVLLATLAGAIAMPIIGISLFAAGQASLTAGSGVVLIIMLVFILTVYLILLLFTPTVTALTYYQLVMRSGAQPDVEPVGMTPIKKLLEIWRQPAAIAETDNLSL